MQATDTAVAAELQHTDACPAACHCLNPMIFSLQFWTPATKLATVGAKDDRKGSGVAAGARKCLGAHFCRLDSSEAPPQAAEPPPTQTSAASACSATSVALSSGVK